MTVVAALHDKHHKLSQSINLAQSMHTGYANYSISPDRMTLGKESVTGVCGCFTDGPFLYSGS